MALLRYNGGLRGLQRIPTPTSASGIWDLEEQKIAASAGIWPGPVAPDPYWDNVSLLLHMDGSDGSTTFIDSSPNNYTVSRAGTCAISTAQSRFGGSSYFSETLSDLLEIQGFVFPTGDFTFECWWYPREFTGGYKCFFHTTGSSGQYQIFTTNDDFTGRRIFVIDSRGPFYITSGVTSPELTIEINQWHHVAVTREGSVLRTFFDGTLHQTGTLNLPLQGTSLLVGYHLSDANSEFGYLDEIRFTSNIARYTSDFTPPTAPFPNF
jgi:hypothetical protein